MAISIAVPVAMAVAIAIAVTKAALSVSPGFVPARSRGSEDPPGIVSEQCLADGPGAREEVNQVQRHQIRGTRLAIQEGGRSHLEKCRLAAKKLVANQCEGYGEYRNLVRL